MVNDATYQRIYTNPIKIKLDNLEETIKKIEQENQNKEKHFRAPIELIRHNQILNQLKYKINNKKLTVKAYKIIQELISKNSELFNDFLKNIENRNLKYEIRHQYPELCQQFGKAEIDYLINDYLRTKN